MPLEPVADERRLRILVLATSLALLAVLFAVGVQAVRAPWRLIQSRSVHSGGKAPGIVQVAACAGELDRCGTCHLGAARQGPADPSVEPVLRSHPPLPRGHEASRLGCTACHGGTARSLDPSTAHASAGGWPDALMRPPHLEASCVRCHVPGDGPGTERVVRGARLYLELGCQLCHPLSGQGRGGQDFGPDLRSSSPRTAAFLEKSVTEPTSDFPDSTMPSFGHAFSEHKEALTDLVVFLESLRLPRSRGCAPRDRSQGLVTLACAACHAGAKGAATGRLAHRCVYLQERKEQLACSGCHEAIPGAALAECPLVAEHRPACAACHDAPVHAVAIR